MTITPADRPRIAAAARTAGELFDLWGDLMLTLTDEWRTGAKAANLDPDTRGNRWAPCGDPACLECPHPVPGDPTGEAVLNARADTAQELQTRLARWHADSLWLRDLAHVLAPIVPPSQMNDVDDRWCSHHLRLGICEPRYRGQDCRCCYDFKALWKILPPVSLLKDRQEGRQWTDRTVKAAIEADGHILDEVNGVTKSVRKARGSTGRPNQNRKAARA